MSSSVVTTGQDADKAQIVDPGQDAPDESGGGGVGTQMPPSKQSANNDVDDVVASLVQTMPDVQEHAIEQASSTGSTESTESTKSQPQQSAPDDGKPRDRHGATFDPLKHRIRKDGSPMLTTKGGLYLIGKSPGRRPSENPSSVVSPGGKAPTDPGDPKPQQRAAGVAAANALIALGVGLGGSEWEPRVDTATGLNERSALESAFGDYFVATGLDDIPPGVALVIAVGCYTLPRLSQPQTKTRAKKLFGWFRNKLIKRKLRKAAKTAVKAASDSNKPAESDDK